MIETSHNTRIQADRKTVWQAIVLPEYVIQWSADVDSALDDMSDYPTINKSYRWHYRMPLVKLTLVDTPLEIAHKRRYFSRGRMIGLHWEETYWLDQLDSGVNVRICLKLACTWPIVGRWVEAIYLQKAIDKQTELGLKQLKLFCENLTEIG